MQVTSTLSCKNYQLQQMSETEAQSLRALLEDSSIVKILHDCRQAAAALFYQKKITMTNVFDTQVTHVLKAVMTG